MQKSSLVFYFLFFFLIFNINISTAKEINITKVTTIEMNEDFTLNVSIKYETSNTNLIDFYTDAFDGFNENSSFEINPVNIL